MSFIYDDPFLIKSLINSAIDFQSKFNKQAQQASVVDKDSTNLNILINNLEKAATPPDVAAKDPNAVPKVSFELNPQDPTVKPKLTSANLESLGALTAFLETNKITVNGQRIVYFEDPNKPEYAPYKLEPNAGLLEVGDRTSVKNAYFVNKDLLVKFIQSRQAALATNPNKVEEVQLGAIIGQANNLLNTKISPKYNPAEISLDPETHLDMLPEWIDEADPFKIGAQELKLKDIQSLTSLNAWLNDKNISIKSGENIINIKQRPGEFDHCVVMRVLLKRAQAWNRTKQDKDAKAMDAYVKQLQILGPNVKGPDGKACALTLGGAQAKPAGTPGAGGAGANAAAIRGLVQMLPLDRQDIDFERIKRFFTAFKSHLAASESPRKAELENNMASAERIMQTATAMTQNNDTRFDMNASWADVRDMLIPPVGGKYIPFLRQLSDIVNQTARVVGGFYAMYIRADERSKDVFTSDERTAVEFQMLGDNSAKVQNLEVLQGLEGNRDKVISIK